MTKLNKLAAIACLSVAGLAGQAMADPMCGMNTGEAATGAHHVQSRCLINLALY
jgi:hypothetical protein